MTVRSRAGYTRTAAVAGAAVAGLTLSACGSTAADNGPAEGEPIEVVASTSVWGSVAKAVGGEDVEVNSIIDDPSADPHSYESSPRDAAEVSKADLVVFNGGGYDEFMQQILSSTGQTTPKVQAFQGENTHEHGEHGQAPAGDHGEAPADEHGEHGQAPADEHGEHGEHGQAPADEHGEHGEAGHSHEHGNEHIWYDLDAVRDVSTKVAHELGELRPELRQAFLDRAASFTDQVGGLQQRVDDIAVRHQGAKVIVTEPLAHYLIERSKLQDITPQSFVNSVESGGDPSVASVAEIRKAVDSGEAAALIYNPQTESRVTEQVRTQAEQQGVPVVRMTETAPERRDYVAWMDAQITALDSALSGRG